VQKLYDAPSINIVRYIAAIGFRPDAPKEIVETLPPKTGNTRARSEIHTG
jgi:hypothetical protein